MAKDPAILFYTSDFLSGVMDLDMEERGQYITLLCAQHQKGHLSDKTTRLLVGTVSVMAKFKKDENGLLFNERMDEEINKRIKFIDSRSINGKLGGRPKASDKPNALPSENLVPKLPENENENRDDNKIDDVGDKSEIPKLYPTFDDFWDAYQKKVDKPRSESKWEKLKQSEKEAIMVAIPNYIKSEPNKQFRKDPSSYIYNRSWENEIIDKTKTNGLPQTTSRTYKTYDPNAD